MFHILIILFSGVPPTRTETPFHRLLVVFKTTALPIRLSTPNDKWNRPRPRLSDQIPVVFLSVFPLAPGFALPPIFWHTLYMIYIKRFGFVVGAIKFLTTPHNATRVTIQWLNRHTLALKRLYTNCTTNQYINL